MQQVDPFRCRVWHLHDRISTGIDESNCRAEIESFAQHGQLIPVLARPIERDSDYEWELIYGARRLFVAKHLKKSLLAEVRDVSDREAIVAMDMENRQRMDISPYERGASYDRWLREGYFECQEDIAEALKISASQVSRLLKLGHLPKPIVDAFESVSDICEGWGLELCNGLEDPERKRRILDVARRIGSENPRPAPRDIYRQLTASSASGRKASFVTHDVVVKGVDGAPLFRVRHQLNTIALIMRSDEVSTKKLQQIQSAVAHLLDTPSTTAKVNAEKRLDALATIAHCNRATA